MRFPARQRRTAFTLLELLVVIGVIVALVGGVALSLAGRSGDGATLAQAQSLIAGLVTAARSEATLHQAQTRLVVCAEPSSAHYLRAVQVVRRVSAAVETPAWLVVGDSVVLPAPICVVPPPPVPADHLRLRAGESWPDDLAPVGVSTLATQVGFSARGANGSSSPQFFGRPGEDGRVYYIEFGPDGAVSAPAAGSSKIAVGATVGGAAVPRFHDPLAVRAVLVRRSGAVVRLNVVAGRR